MKNKNYVVLWVLMVFVGGLALLFLPSDLVWYIRLGVVVLADYVVGVSYVWYIRKSR